jgi:hypothetical protein
MISRLIESLKSDQNKEHNACFVYHVLMLSNLSGCNSGLIRQLPPFSLLLEIEEYAEAFKTK